MQLRKIKTCLSVMVLALPLMACGNNNANQELDVTRNNKNNNNDNDSTISSMYTQTASHQYPHTVPVETQKAKYEFRVVYGQNDWQRQQSNAQPRTWMQNQLNQRTAAPSQWQTQQWQTHQGGTKRAQTQASQQQPTTQAKKQTQQITPATQDQTTQQPATAQQPTTKAPSSTGISQYETRVIELTNVERKRNGLTALQADTSLGKVAREKANDMQTKNYFSHTSPTYGSPFDMMRDFGVSYTAAGENIAHGQRTPEEVVQAWMNSEGHRKNILSANFTHIGVGYSQTGSYWSQMFIKK